MKFAEFSQNLKSTLQDRLEKAMSETERPYVAAFDADGTLWSLDAGEAFFQYQIKTKKLKLPQHPWEHYHKWKEHDPRAAYLWLAQINEGLELEKVRGMAEECFLELEPYPYFESQRALIQQMHLLGIEVYVVTASVKWAVEPAAKRLGIPQERVLGVQTAVEKGLVTGKQLGPITWKEGKPEALLTATNNVRPIFCSGNTIGDLALLESSTHVRLAVRSHGSGPELMAAEAELFKHVYGDPWLTHQF